MSKLSGLTGTEVNLAYHTERLVERGRPWRILVYGRHDMAGRFALGEGDSSIAIRPHYDHRRIGHFVAKPPGRTMR